MKAGTWSRALREEPLPALVREAAWRGVRSLRKWRFESAGPGDKCPVRFRPIGYYQAQKQLSCELSREATLAYADAVLGGKYPLMGYGSPHLGSHPDWQCDWVSGKTWPLESSQKIQIVRHDGSDVKAPWELSRLQWSPVVAKAYVLTGERKSGGSSFVVDGLDRAQSSRKRGELDDRDGGRVAGDQPLPDHGPAMAVYRRRKAMARSNDRFAVAASAFHRGS